MELPNSHSLFYFRPGSSQHRVRKPDFFAACIQPKSRFNSLTMPGHFQAWLWRIQRGLIKESKLDARSVSLTIRFVINGRPRKFLSELLCSAKQWQCSSAAWPRRKKSEERRQKRKRSKKKREKERKTRREREREREKEERRGWNSLEWLGAFAPISRILRRISLSSWLRVEFDDAEECRLRLVA